MHVATGGSGIFGSRRRFFGKGGARHHAVMQRGLPEIIEVRAGMLRSPIVLNGIVRRSDRLGPPGRSRLHARILPP